MAEGRGVQLLGLGVPILEFVALGLAALGGAVVDLPAERLPAKLLPIGPGVDEVEVPYLVHLVAGRERMRGDADEEHEAFVFLDGPEGVGEVPAVFAGEAVTEAEGRSGIVEGEGLSFVPKVQVFLSHLGIYLGIRGMCAVRCAGRVEFTESSFWGN